MSKYYDDLLLLCGYEPEEIEEERNRLEEVFRRIGLGPKDFIVGEERVRSHYQIDMIGVRKLLGAYLKELTDIVMAADEGRKCVYFGYPAMMGPGLILQAAAGDKLQICAPDVVIAHTLGLIFDKLTPILQAGEQNGLPPGHALCSLWQTKIGGISLGIVPPPAFNFSSGYFCDMSAVGDSLIRNKYGTPAGIIDCCLDGRLGEYPYRRPEKVKFLGLQIEKAMEKAQQVLDIKVEPRHFEEGLDSTWKFRDLCGTICEYIKADPVPLSLAGVELIESISGCTTGRGMNEAVKALEILIPELKNKVENGEGVTPKGAPRVMILHGHMGDPRVSMIYENVGLAVPITYIMAWNGGLRVTVEETYDTPYEQMAAHELAIALPYGAVDSVNTLFVQASKLCRVDGFIQRNLHHCRPASIGSRQVKQFLEEKTGLPVLNMDEDMVDSRVYSADYMLTKIETFAELLKAQKKWEVADTLYD